MIHTKLTSKNQATIPKEIREKLDLKAGDRITFEIRADGSIQLRKSRPFDLEYTKALESTLDEWGSKLDEKDYEDL